MKNSENVDEYKKSIESFMFIVNYISNNYCAVVSSFGTK